MLYFSSSKTELCMNRYLQIVTNKSSNDLLQYNTLFFNLFQMFLDMEMCTYCVSVFSTANLSEPPYILKRYFRKYFISIMLSLIELTIYSCSWKIRNIIFMYSAFTYHATFELIIAFDLFYYVYRYQSKRCEPCV